MMQELYINGEALDMEPGTKVTLNFKSNLLGELSKITASNSQTVKVPKTSRNRRLLDNPTAPAYDSTFRYKRHKCRYVQNGIELVNGYAVLLDSSDDYEIALYWGVMSQFQEWLDKDLSLNELSTNIAVPWSEGVELTLYRQFINEGYGYAFYNNGVVKMSEEGSLMDNSLVTIFPSVTAAWLLSEISADAGITFEFPDGMMDVLNRVAIPCVDIKAGEGAWNAAAFAGVAEVFNLSAGSTKSTMCTLNAMLITNDPRGIFKERRKKEIYGWVFYDEIDHWEVVKTCYYAVFYTLDAEQIRVHYADSTPYRYTVPVPKLYMRCLDEDGKEMKTITFESKQFDDATQGFFFDVDEIVDVEDVDTFYFELDGVPAGAETFSITNALKLTVEYDELEYGRDELYPIVPNLPDIEQVKFIQSLCEMFGLFAVGDPDDLKKIRFVSLDVLQDRKVSAVNWSGRLIYDKEKEPEEVGFSFGDYAKRNLFKYKEDDDVPVSGDGEILLDNETLEPEKEVVELPFSASDGSSIIQWELNDDGTEVSSMNASPRIMMASPDDGGFAKLSFAGLSFDALIPKYYNTLEDLLQRAIRIKVKMRLNELDLKTLDVTTPVYLEQFGRYYAIETIQAEGETSTVELVQLPFSVTENKIYAYVGKVANRWAINVMADRAVASTLEVGVSYFVGSTRHELTLTVDAGGSFAGITTTHTSEPINLKIESITPDADAIYRYVVDDRAENQISMSLDGGLAVVFNSQYPIESSVTISWSLVDVSGTASAKTSIIEAGQTQSSATSITRNFTSASVTSISPSFSERYRYKVINSIEG